MTGTRLGLWAGATAFFLLATAHVCSAEVIRVTVKNLVYSPAQISARVGDTIEWDNQDFIIHTSTARDKSWEVMLPAHTKGQMVMKKAGTIEYYCKFHPNMKGQITVTEK
ncbi:MAG TPA: cupredoxin domain-containing protein [Xanthobacteraceae bacterium]|jgi:plastocyanin|nr:cupredoxin domain-containing protein [Xanthobacteraceae bacterium]